jgi:hypothetical protein
VTVERGQRPETIHASSLGLTRNLDRVGGCYERASCINA